MKKNRKKQFKTITIIFLVIILFVLSPIFPFVRSLTVMGIFSKINEKQSLMEETGLYVHIPGGLTTKEADWYPFTMTFVADSSYAKCIGEEDARLSILYNFPAFSYTKGSSRLFDTKSPYYNSFYGAYIVRDTSNQALAAGEMDGERVAEIAWFDFYRLVLSEFGLTKKEAVFDFTIEEKKTDIEFAGFEGWTRIRADIMINGSAHNKREKVVSYLQYGPPGFGAVEEEFLPVPMTGIVYGRYFEEEDMGIYFYVIGQEEVCLECEKEILSNARIESR